MEFEDIESVLGEVRMRMLDVNMLVSAQRMDVEHHQPCLATRQRADQRR